MQTATYFELIDELAQKKRFTDELDLVYELIPPRERDLILDVGCGTGRLGKYIWEKSPNAYVVFSDISDEAKKYLEGYTFVQAEMGKIPLPNEYFDKIYCLHTIGHTNSPLKALKEANRISKKGGTLAIVMPNIYHIWYMNLYYQIIRREKYERDSTLKHLFTIGQLTHLLRQAGWNITEARTFGAFTTKWLPFNFMRWHTIVIARKSSNCA